MGAGLLTVKSGFLLFIKSYQFPLQINTLERAGLAVKSGFILFIKNYQFPLQINTLERDGGGLQRVSALHVAVVSIRGRHVTVAIRQQVFAFADSARSYSVD